MHVGFRVGVCEEALSHVVHALVCLIVLKVAIDNKPASLSLTFGAFVTWQVGRPPFR